MFNKVGKIYVSGFFADDAYGLFIYTIENHELTQSAHSLFGLSVNGYALEKQFFALFDSMCPVFGDAFTGLADMVHGADQVFEGMFEVFC